MSNPIKIAVYLVRFFLVLVFLSLPAQALGGEEKLVAILVGGKSQPYLRTVKGLKQIIKQSDFTIKFVEYELPSGAEINDQLIEEINQLKPDLIVSIGSNSTKLVSEKISDVPIVFSMVLDPVRSGLVQSLEYPGKIITGSCLNIPIHIQLEKFKLIIPHVKKIGVLFSSETEELVKEAEETALNIGLELISTKINSEKQMPEALEYLCREADGLWAVPDAFVYTPQSTQFILLYTLRNGIPFMGTSPAFVQAGALLCLSADYKDVGRQSGEQVLQILRGVPPGQIPVSVPRMIYLSLNLKTAKQINLKIPPDIIGVAKEVIE